MPRHDGDLTVMEEILTTMRYKGIAVLAAGVSADLMSLTLLDTGFIAQYRSHSLELAKSLAITEKLVDVIPTLSNYQCIVNMSIRRTGPMLVNINRFPHSLLSENEHDYKDKGVTILDEFVLDDLTTLRIRLELLAEIEINYFERKKYQEIVEEEIIKIAVPVYFDKNEFLEFITSTYNDVIQIISKQSYAYSPTILCNLLYIEIYLLMSRKIIKLKRNYYTIFSTYLFDEGKVLKHQQFI